MVWTSEEAALATNGACFSEWKGGKLVFDSRLIEEGDVFIALPGAQVDGHEYVQQALNKGAAAAIVSYIPKNIENKDKLLLVNSTLDALHDLAKYKRETSKAKFIAVTGSVGKTSTKEQLGLALSAYGKAFYSRGNYNNFLGVPINLASLPDDVEYAIFEMGMDHAGEITPLSKMVKPHVAIITAVENIHRANFDSMEGIANAKAEIFDGLVDDGIAIINSLSNCYALIREKAKNANKIFSMGVDSKLVYYSVKDGKTKAILSILGEEVIIEFDNILAKHQVYNMLASVTCVAALGLDPHKSIENLQDFKLPRGRGLVSKISVDAKAITLIDDSYNAGPVSVKAALKNMAAYSGRKIAILGDMVELGPESLEMHIGLKEDIIANNIDQVICFGRQMQNLYQALPEDKKMASFLDLKSLARDLPGLLEEGDVLLIKGSLYINNLYGFAKHLTDGTLERV
jgi:UDP-N-acetylmuramoyl-tripeptide--D-alanyl-D-alanine ligase